MKNLLFILLTLHVSLFTLHPSEAQIIHVPADYPSIQEGINAANPGDTVLVADSLYYENIDFLGKPLIVASNFLIDGDTNHINNTIINGSQPDDPNWGSVVIMQNGEDSTSVLCGFTITGGTGTFVAPADNSTFGGGVFISNGGKITNNHIEYNTVTCSSQAAGGGVWMGGGPGAISLNCVLRNNRIAHNTVLSYNYQGLGGGVAGALDLILEDNEIIFNEASGSLRGDGGGVNISGVWGHIDLEIRNNKIKYNKAISNSDMTDIVISGGMDIFNDCSGIVSGNDISYNEIEVSIDAWGYGTGVLVQLKDIPSPDFVFENNKISNNTFSGGFCVGGGLCIYESGGTYQNNVIRKNEGTHGGGIAIAYNTADNLAFLTNNNMTDNSATYGGGLYVISADAVVLNSIIWGNDAQYSPSISYDQSTLEVAYSDVEGDDYWPGEGNENVDPGFGEDGYHLSVSTPLEGSGIEATVINGITYECPEYDIDWEPRPCVLPDPEIGADEICWVSVEESAVGSRQSSVECYPNPTSGIVDFRLSMVDGRWVSLKIYDVQGREVAVVLDEQMPAGAHAVRVDVSYLTNGVYFLRMTDEKRVYVSKLVVQ